jgi:integrase
LLHLTNYLGKLYHIPQSKGYNRFHDLRHTAINNWRLQGHDYFRIMAATGHKTMSVFKRYNTVSREELKILAGRAESPPKIAVMDTYMDTKPK